MNEPHLELLAGSLGTYFWAQVWIFLRLLPPKIGTTSSFFYVYKGFGMSLKTSNRERLERISNINQDSCSRHFHKENEQLPGKERPYRISCL